MNQTQGSRPRRKFIVLKWVSIFIVVTIALFGTYLLYHKYVGVRAEPTLIRISFNNDVDRQTAEQVLNQYGEKKEESPNFDLRHLAGANYNKTAYTIFQGRLYDIKLEIKSSDVLDDVNALRNNELFTIVEPYCNDPKTSQSSCIHIMSKEDANYEKIIAFIKSKGFSVKEEFTNPIYAMFYAPVDKQEEWFNTLKEDSHFKNVDWAYLDL